MVVKGLNNAVWDLLKYTHGRILTTFGGDGGATSANAERSKIDWYGLMFLYSIFCCSVAHNDVDLTLDLYDIKPEGKKRIVMI